MTREKKTLHSGDEYVIIWYGDLIPSTKNEDPYDYDSQEEPKKMDHPITRQEIIQVVIDVSEQDCLGTLSNIHLAYADKDGIKSEICKRLAGDISQEVDAAKTGKHPLTDEQIGELRRGLNNRWPDFMKGRGKTDIYPSERVLGKLYRSARRAMIGWNRAIHKHCNPRHADPSIQLTTDSLLTTSIDPDIHHPNADQYLGDVQRLYKLYEDDLLEIITVYRFQDEIDLFCRCDTADASGGGGAKKGTLEDSAATEVKSLIDRIREDFFAEFKKRQRSLHCCSFIEDERTHRMRMRSCEICSEGKLAKAACLYRYTYKKSARLSPTSNRRILSLPWYFAEFLIHLKYRNQPENTVDRSKSLIGEAFAAYPLDFTPQFKFITQENAEGEIRIDFFYKRIEQRQNNSLNIRRIPEETIGNISLIQGYFIQVLDDWLMKQEIFGEICCETDEKPLIPVSIWHEVVIEYLRGEYRSDVQFLPLSISSQRAIDRYREQVKQCRNQWTDFEYEQFHDMFRQLQSLIEQHVKRTKETIWTYLHEYVLLALQSIAIEKRLDKSWICPKNVSRKDDD